MNKGGHAGKEMVVMLAGLHGRGLCQYRLEHSEIWVLGKGVLGIES